MSLFSQLKLSKSTSNSIEWTMTPDLAFCTFSAKGLRDALTNTEERICYFFIDNWGTQPRLYLMERGVRHVHILAEIKAPLDLLYKCITGQGGTATSRDNYPIDDLLKQWLITYVVEPEYSAYIIPMIETAETDEDMGSPLPEPGYFSCRVRPLQLPTNNEKLDDDQIEHIVRQWNFFDQELHPEGNFANAFTQPPGKPVIIDEHTGLIWQQGGLELSSIRTMKQAIEQLNIASIGGYKDWRLPTIEEALSLMESTANSKGLYLAPCFSSEQPFIFTAARRRPTGYWFVDYKQGKIYWSSGTVPGGFARLCRDDK